MKGVRFDPDNMTPEVIGANWKKVCSFDGKNDYPVYNPVWSDKVKEFMNKPML